MIPKPITAPFRWWAKHPWIVFWGIFLLIALQIVLLALLREIPLLTGTLLIDLLNFVARTTVRLVPIVLILSFILGMFLNWQRSKSATIVVVVFILVSYAIIDAQFSIFRRRAYFSEIRSNLMKAADAQRSYFAKNNSFKSCVACTSRDLPGFHNRSKVTLKAETGRTGFVLTATHKKCGDSVWTYQSTTETITGPSHQEVCK